MATAFVRVRACVCVCVNACVCVCVCVCVNGNPRNVSNQHNSNFVRSVISWKESVLCQPCSQAIAKHLMLFVTEFMHVTFEMSFSMPHCNIYLHYINKPDSCFNYHNKHNTLNTTHFFIICNMFRPFVLAIIRLESPSHVWRWRPHPHIQSAENT
jgi:hypothetical protein